MATNENGRCGKIQKDLIDLMLKDHTLRFDNSFMDTDERTETEFKVNSSKLLADDFSSVADLLLCKIQSDIYNNIGVDCIVGYGDSGTILSTAIQTILQEDQKRPKNEQHYNLKEYRWAYLNKNGEVIGNLTPGDRVAIIDEIGIHYNSIIKAIPKINSTIDYLVTSGKCKTEDANKKFSYPVVLVGLDLMVVDPEHGKYRKDIVAEQIRNSYNPNIETKILSIITIENFIEYVGEERKEIIKSYVNLQKSKLTNKPT